NQPVELRTGVGEERFSTTKWQINKRIPPDSMLWNVGIMHVAVETDPLVDVVRHRSRQETIGLVNGVDGKVPPLSGGSSRGRRVAKQIEELERRSLAVSALCFQLNAVEIGVTDLAVDPDISVRRLVERSARCIGVEPRRQWQSTVYVPDIVADRIRVEQ